MDIHKTSNLLRLSEGEEPWVYPDSKGIWTIGVGRNVDKDRGGPGLRESEIKFMLANDLAAWHQGLVKAIPWFSTLSDVRQAVLVDMAHNLKGNVYGLLKFQNMLAAMAAQRWSEAGNHLMASKYSGDTPNRALRNKRMIVTDKWPAGI